MTKSQISICSQPIRSSSFVQWIKKKGIRKETLLSADSECHCYWTEEIALWVIEFVKVIVLPFKAICRFDGGGNLQKGGMAMKLVFTPLPPPPKPASRFRLLLALQSVGSEAAEAVVVNLQWHFIINHLNPTWEAGFPWAILDMVRGQYINRDQIKKLFQCWFCYRDPTAWIISCQCIFNSLISLIYMHLKNNV